jgi:hypothetical protein
MIEDAGLTGNGIDLAVDGPVSALRRGARTTRACRHQAHAARTAPIDGRAAADGVPRAGRKHVEDRLGLDA